MSVDFSISQPGQRRIYDTEDCEGSSDRHEYQPCEDCQTLERDLCPSLNLSNSNAFEVGTALGLDMAEGYGQVRARALALACERYLAGDHPDPARETRYEAAEGRATVVHCGRRSGYVAGRVRELLSLARRAGDLGVITWG